MGRTDNSLRNMATGVAGQVVTLILQFVYRTIFIQLLGGTYLSVNGLFTNILSIFSFAELGIGQAIVFSLYKPIRDNDIPKIQALMRLYKKTYMLIGTTIFALGLLFMPLLPVLMSDSAKDVENLYLLYLLFVFDTGITYFFSYHQSFLMANQKQYVLNLANSLLAIVKEVARIVLVLITKSYLPMLIFNVAFNVVQNSVHAIYINKMFPFLRGTKDAKLPAEERKGIFKNVRALLIYKVGSLALNSTDNIIITAMVGLNWVGMYSNYQVLVTSVSAFITTIFSSLTASIGNLNAGDDNEHKRRIFKVTNLATFWFYAIASVCFLVALTPTVTVWLGDAWTLDFATVVVICLNVYVSGMLYAPYNYRQTMGLFVYGKWRPIISAVVNLGVSVVLGHFWGLKGVLAGTAIARLTTNAWFDPYIVYKKGFKKNPMEYYVQYLFMAVLLVISGCIGLLISKLYIVGGIIDILVHCVLCAVVLSGLYTIIFCRTEQFQYIKMVALQYWKRFRGRLVRKKGNANEIGSKAEETAAQGVSDLVEEQADSKE